MRISLFFHLHRSVSQCKMHMLMVNRRSYSNSGVFIWDVAENPLPPSDNGMDPGIKKLSIAILSTALADFYNGLGTLPTTNSFKNHRRRSRDAKMWLMQVEGESSLPFSFQWIAEEVLNTDPERLREAILKKGMKSAKSPREKLLSQQVA